jgi:hypothetical protein
MPPQQEEVLVLCAALAPGREPVPAGNPVWAVALALCADDRHPDTDHIERAVAALCARSLLERVTGGNGFRLTPEGRLVAQRLRQSLGGHLNGAVARAEALAPYLPGLGKQGGDIVRAAVIAQRRLNGHACGAWPSEIQAVLVEEEPKLAAVAREAAALLALAGGKDS